MSTDYDDLFHAILAMDAYNRGYEPGLDVYQSDQKRKIGNAEILLDDDGNVFDSSNALDNADQPASFYAIAYQLGGETVISYRGTDDKNIFTGDIPDWAAGAGVYDTDQTRLAAEFYREVADATAGNPSTNPISLTGHSLGGGLAGFVGSIYGVDAVMFDNMPYENAADGLYYATTEIQFDTGDVTDPAALTEFYLDGTPPPIQQGQTLKGFAVRGESLEWVRDLTDQSDNVAYLGGALDTDLSAKQLHSQSLLVLLMYAEVNAYSTSSLTPIDPEWILLENELLPQLFNEEIALALNIEGKGIRGEKSADDKMRDMIAYSAISEGETVFGNVAVQAMYDDAADVGKALAPLDVPSLLNADDTRDALSQIIVQYAGLLAANKEHAGGEDALENGVMDYDSNNNLLTVSLDPDQWQFKGGDDSWYDNAGEVTDIVGRDSLVEAVFEESDPGQLVPSDLPIEMFVFKTVNDESSWDIAPMRSGPDAISDEAYLAAVGSDGNETISGSSGNDLISGSAGDDILIGGAGDDILDGGADIDTVSYQSASSGIVVRDTGVTSLIGAYLEILDGDGGVDLVLGSTELLLGSEHGDVVDLDSPEALTSIGILQESIAIDLGGQGEGERDVLDMSGSDEGLAFSIGSDSANVHGQYGSISIKGVEEIVGTAHDDIFIATTPGMLVHTGGGNDVILYSEGLGVTDADADDRVVMYDTITLSSAQRNGKSEDPYAYTVGHSAKIGFNKDGEMVIGNHASVDGDDATFMYFMDAEQDPLAPTSELTAGIRVYELEIDSYLLMEKPAGVSVTGSNQDLWQLVAHLIEDMDANAKVASSDPLVLDLDGDGIELTGVLSPRVGAEFDIDGDGFAEQTGWVGRDDGLLAIDVNGNGVIDDIDELFGKGSTSGYAELTPFDSNADGVVDANDDRFDELLVWQDKNGDAVTDAGELSMLGELGIASIDLAHTETNTQVGDNTIARSGLFTYDDGTTGAVGDVEFRVDNFNTVYLGDTSVDPVLTDGQPNLKGYGTLTDMHVALTLDGANGNLSNAINANLGNLNTLDLSDLRDAAMPIYQAWADATPVASTGGNTDIVLLMDHSADGAPTVVNFAIFVTEPITLSDGQTVMSTHYKMVGGGAVLASDGSIIAAPTINDIVSQPTGDPDLEWDVMTGAELDFLERYMGEELPLDDMDGLGGSATVGAFSDLLAQLNHQLNLMSISLAMQGPLEPYFAGIEYDAAVDVFRPTTNDQLVPMLEAIFADAPASDPQAWLESWEPVLETMLSNYDRGGAHLQMTQSFVFTNVVAAYENAPIAGISLEQTAIALGVNGDMLQFGSGVRDGTSDADLFYVSSGDDVLRGGAGDDTYVFGRDFGSDVIEEYEYLATSFDTIRFAHLNPEDIEATRIGIDLVLTEIGTNNSITIKNQFHELEPGMFGGQLNADESIEEIIFADGTVWTPLEMAKAVSRPDATDQTIIGTDRMDFLDGGAGNDFLSGGDNIDFYTFDLGYGQDTIEDNQENVLLEGTDVLTFGPGVQFDDLTFFRDADSLDLEISIAGTTDSLTIVGQFDGFYSGPFGLIWLDRIESFEFADGSSMSWDDVFQKVLDDISTEGDDIIHGIAREDVLDGGAGNDFLSGGEESDTYVFEYGYGQDTIHEGQEIILSNGNDKVVFGEGVSAVDLEFERVGNSNDLVINLAGTSDSLTIINQFEAFYSGPFGTLHLDRIETFEFAGDPEATLTWYAIIEQVTAEAKTDGDDVIYGFAYEDVLDGGTGDDYLSGGSENDTYIFGVGYGNDVIFEGLENNILSGQDDRVVFSDGITANDLSFSREAGNKSDLIIEINGTNDTLRVQDTFSSAGIAQTIYDVETYEFSDGSSMSIDEIGDIILAQTITNGSDTTEGFRDDDVIASSAGDDFLNGWNGDDTYEFDLGTGHDTIHEQGSFAGQNSNDVVAFGQSIVAADISVARNGRDLVLSHANGTDSLTIVDQFLGRAGSTDHFAIDSFSFTDGTVWSAADVRIMTMAGTAGADTIIGFDDDDTIEGGLGNDYLEGREGSDTYVFNRGDGEDTIYEGGGVGTDRLLINGYQTSEVTLSGSLSDPDHLLISFAGTTDTITVQHALNENHPYQVEEFVFEDGTIWTISDVRGMLADNGSAYEGAIVGTDGADTISGTTGADIIIGGLGDDTLNGSIGGDTYVYSSGDGSDVIDDVIDFSGVDRLEFTDLNASDVTVSRSSTNTNDLAITINATGDVVTVDDQFLNGFYGVEEIAFGDGTIWDAATIQQKAWIRGTDGDDILNGSTSADTISGGLGNDTLKGSNGGDTYVYSSGDGSDLIDDVIDFSGTDRLEFTDLNASDVTVSRSSTNTNDLAITINATGDVVTVDDQFLNGFYGVEEIAFADGTTWDAATIQQEAWIRGTNGDDTINGSTSADTISGGLGDDTLNGSMGGDTYVYSSGDGSDVIDDIIDFSGTDRLEFTDLNASDVTVSRSSANTNDLAVEVNATGQVITVDDQFLNGRYGVEEIAFADGTIWDAATIQQEAWIRGTDGDDTVIGTNGADTVSGGLGNDVLTGGTGNDTFVFRDGFGADTITDFTQNVGNDDLIEIDTALAADYTVLQAFMSDVAGSDTAIDFGGGNNLTIAGVGTADLGADDFRFVA